MAHSGQFKAGRSGNPGGRPKDKPFKTALNMEIKAAGEDHKALREIAKKLLDMAREGDLAAMREIADRLDGKPVAQHEHAGTGGGPIQFMDLSNLTDEQLKQLDKILTALGESSADNGGEDGDRAPPAGG